MLALEDKTAADLEEDFIAGLDAAAARSDELTSIVAHVREAGEGEQADEWADLLQDAFGALEDPGPALILWELRCSWHEGDAAFRKTARKIVDDLFKADMDSSRFVKNAGFDLGVPLSECVRRLKLLISLKPGVLCYNKTWGAGPVKDVDAFYEKIRIDFDRKKDHELAFSYAAESLEVLPESHLLYLKHRDPEGLKSMIADEPDEIVRRALATWGAVTVPILQELLTESLVPPDDWKRFWDAARRGLKKDALIEIPTKRTEPIRVLAKAKAYDGEWFDDLAKVSDIDDVLRMIPELLAAKKATDLESGWLEICENRLLFVLKGTLRRQNALAARAVLLGCRLGLTPVRWEDGTVVRELTSRVVLLKDLATFPIKDLHVILEHVLEHEPDRLADGLIGMLADMHLVLLSDVLELLIGAGQEDRCADVFRRSFGSRAASAEFIVWISRRLEKMDSWGLGSAALLPGLGMDALRAAEMGERLKGQNHLVEVFGDRAWLESVTSTMSPQEHKDLVVRIQRESLGVPLDRAMLTARMIRLYPDLQEALSSDEKKEEEAAAAKVRYTSWRTLKERQEELKRIVEVEVPENSKEIALARSYGDLRENHEYKSAKEHQALLMRRQGEMEQDLKEVRGTDFAEFRTDEAGPGTMVTVERPGGVTQSYSVLGEWDRDEALQIISSESRVGQTLKGHKIGEQVELPGADGAEPCRITEIKGLTDEVRSWAQAAILIMAAVMHR